MRTRLKVRKSEDYEQISLLKDEIKLIAEELGFKCVNLWFEEISQRSAYLNLMLKDEVCTPDQFTDQVIRLSQELAFNEIPLSLEVVCHLPGDFAFKVSLD